MVHVQLLEECKRVVPSTVVLLLGLSSPCKSSLTRFAAHSPCAPKVSLVNCMVAGKQDKVNDRLAEECSDGAVEAAPSTSSRVAQKWRQG